MAYLEATLLADDLPPDGQVIAVTLHDAVSELFSATIDFATSDPDLDLEGLLGKPVAVRVDGVEDGALVVHGQVESAEYVDARRDQHHYRVTLAPLIQALAHRVRSRIFQDKDVVQIVQQVFKDAGIPTGAVSWHTTGTYPRREFCVQYKESELAFVMRLLEEEGIFFCFEHQETAHILHILDNGQDLPTIAGDPAITAAAQLHGERESLTDLVISRRVTPDLFLTRDWDFHRPDQPAESKAELAPEPAIDFYEYPGTFQAPADGGRIARVRAEQAGLPGRLLRGESNSVRIVAGRKMTVVDAPVPQFDGDYYVVGVRHRFQAPFFETQGGGRSFFRAWFRAIPAAVPLRPARRTPKPRITGIESAVVTGPPGEEIHVDEFGRVKVHFFWDREGKIDDKASCWIRVQQQNTSGSMLLPRVGWELGIGFLDGDPDRPVALQKLYNRETMPPYMMPDNKTQSSLQSATSPGGGATNEIRLQDGAAGMEFFIHSSRDFSLTAGNDAIEDIKVDAHEEIGLRLDTKVGVDETVKVGAAHSVNVTGDATDQTSGSKKVNIGALDDWGVTGELTVGTGGNRSETIGGLMNVLANQIIETYSANYTRTVGAVLSLNSASTLAETVNGSKTETVGGAKMELVARAKAEQVGGSKTLTSGLVTEITGTDIALTTETVLAINVGGPIVEQCGDAFTLGAGSVVVTAGGGADMKVGGTSLSAKGSTLKVKASSLGAAGGPKLSLKGKINYKG